jgi:ABC-type amino acid transport substrate-binding protein
MNFLPFVKFDLTWLVEHFLELVRDQYWLSVLILWAILTIVAVYAGSVVVSGVRLANSLLPRLRSWYVSLLVVLGSASLLALSMAMSAYLRGTRLPVPSLSDLKIVLGEDELLRWDLPPGSADLTFEVQWSTDPRFPAALSYGAFVKDTIYPLDATRNETFYWRVRVLDLDGQGRVPHRFGTWSKSVKIEQYANVLEKIKRTRRITVAMENEFGRSRFRWYHPEVDERRRGEILDQAVSYRGVDVEIAYAIADEACRELFKGQSEDGKPMACLPSRSRHAPDPAVCRDKKCVSVEVHVVPVPWSEVMKSVGEGRVDMAISSITYVPERENRYNILFSTKSYERTRYGVVSKNDGNWPAGTRRFTLAADALKGKRVGAQPETTGYRCVRHLLETFARGGEKDSFRIVDQSRDLTALAQIVRGKAPFDVLIKDSTTAEGWEALHGDGILVEHTPEDFFGPDAPDFCRSQEYRVAVRAGEFGLQELIDNVLARTDWLARIKDEAARQYAGYLRRLRARVFGVALGANPGAEQTP